MGLRSKIMVNNQPIEAIIDYLQGYGDVVQEESDAAFAEIQPQFVDELQYQPGHAVYPIEWTSDKQRKFVMAKLRSEGNLPYQRTGALAAGWNVTKEGTGTAFTISVVNPSPIAKFVEGSLARSNPGGFMQQMHINTGWIPAYKTVNYWFDAYKEVFFDNMAARLGDLVGNTTIRQRAYTGGSR